MVACARQAVCRPEAGRSIVPTGRTYLFTQFPSTSYWATIKCPSGTDFLTDCLDLILLPTLNVAVQLTVILDRSDTKYIAGIQQYDAEVKLEAKQKLKALAATVSQDIKTRVLLRQDTPHRGIINAARQDRCDLITLRTRGLKGLKNYILGSTAEKVVRHALCPVLTFNRY
jgi:nucleotide-binding universal stress UspA family protein